MRLSLTVPDTGHVTGEDVNRAMALADAVARYIAELGEHVADEDTRRAGCGVNGRGGWSWYLRPPLFLPLAVRQRKR